MVENKAQEEVINTIEGQLIVIACPGSGKTTTLVRRIHHMVNDCGIPSEHILMITFTKASAIEMKERYHKMYGKDEATFCTIHALCLAILRKFKGITNDNILVDSRDFFYEALKNNKKINDKAEFIKLITNDISVIKNNNLDIEDYSPQCCKDKDLFLEMFKSYEDYKRTYSLIDFDDMLSEAYTYMKENHDCLNWLRHKFQYIQVDEYQDVNYLQRDIVYLLAGENGNLAVVGDDDQSIYGFRGARPDVMLKFNEYYPDAKFIRMNTNYRSCSGIIKAADCLIQNNVSRFDKEFLAFHKESGNVRRFNCETRTDEIHKVIEMIQELVKQGEDISDIAVLYRTNYQSELVADMMMESKIPFVSTEKVPSCYQHWMFEDIRSYKKLADKKNWSNQDLIRVLNHPQRFLFDYKYIQAGLNMRKMRDVVFKTITIPWKRSKALETISEFFNALNKMKGKSPSEFLKNLDIYADYLRYIEDYASFRNIDSIELNNIWKKYKKDAEKYNDWKEWSQYINRYNHAIENAQKNKSGVRLSTMHGAKGLEWKHVFVIDCIDGICPHNKALNNSDIEEERRLFYVAMTRAKECLYMFSYRKNGDKEVKISPFLK